MDDALDPAQTGVVLVALGLPALVITVLVMCAVSAAVLLINIKSLAASLRALNSMK